MHSKEDLKSKTENFNKKENMFSKTMDDLQQETRSKFKFLESGRLDHVSLGASLDFSYVLIHPARYNQHDIVSLK